MNERFPKKAKNSEIEGAHAEVGTVTAESAASSLREAVERLQKDQDLDAQTRRKELLKLKLEMEDRRTELERNLEGERAAFQESRDALGLPATDEASHAMKRLESELENVRLVTAELENALIDDKKSEGAIEDESQFKREALQAVEALELFVGKLRARENDGMDPFIDSVGVSRIKAGGQSLIEVGESHQRADMQKLHEAVFSINAGFERMAPARNAASLQESVTQLAQLAGTVRDVHSAVERMMSTIPERGKSAHAEAQKLLQKCEQVWEFLMRRKHALEEYLR